MTEPRIITGRSGSTLADGRSIPFDSTSTDPRHIVAFALARSENWAEIRPGHWRTAGRVVKELKAAKLLIGRPPAGRRPA